MKILKSHVCGQWVEGRGGRIRLVNPATEEPLAGTSTEGVDFRAALEYARSRGGPALREMTFAERGKLLAAMASAIHEIRDELIDLSISNGGNTRGDARFDIDGAIYTLSTYSEIGEALGNVKHLEDGEAVQLGRSPRFVGRHIRVPRTGAAVHINAFNFPAWGFAEKAAVALLAGMPVVTKPATSTAMAAERIVEQIVEKKILPDGSLSFIAGPAGRLLEHLESQDVVAFTGSGETGFQIRSRENLLRKNVRVSVEADSLNAAVLGPDVEAGSETYELFLREVVKDMTQKAGQKCTAIRRIFAPASVVGKVREDLIERLSQVRVGNPALREVGMGPLVSRAQLEDVLAGMDRIRSCAEVAFASGKRGGRPGRGNPIGVDADRGFFVSPVLFYAEDAPAAREVHRREVFGPCATLFPYSGAAEEAARWVALGDGALVSSVYSDDVEFIRRWLRGMAPYLGRVHLGSARIAEHSPGPGTVLPLLVHGGPGRAGGGEELGGLRGLEFYTQRTAVQGDMPFLRRVLGET